MEEQLLKTPLYDCHVAAGGKIVPFAGYLLPVQYEGTGQIVEHKTVRTGVGMFDVSHMGETLFEGPDAFKTVSNLVTADLSDMQPGDCHYSPMCYDDGGFVDDLIVYKFADDKFYIVVNAANRHKDVAWMKEHLLGDVKFTDISDEIAQIALQGPLAPKVVAKLADADQIPEGNYTFIEKAKVAGIETVCMSRTGYTGEDGFEIYTKAADGPAMWNALLEAGEEFGIIPCGLGARDTLRLEAAMPLYGHEMDETVNPYEARIGIFVKLDKEGGFIGHDALVPVKGNVTRKRVGLKVTGRGIIREHCDCYDGDKLIGHVTSGTFCPYINGAYGMAILDMDHQEVGTPIQVDVRGKKVDCEICKLPFYKRG